MTDIFKFVKREKLSHFSNEKRIEELRSQFQSASPFHHIVIDGLFNDGLVSQLISSFPKPDEKKWWAYNNPLEKKLAFNDLTQLPACFSEFFDFTNSKTFIAFLESLTGVRDLLADPGLNGGGLHQIMPGGKLDVHEDYNIHRSMKALRKLNAILYLNENWNEEWGGHLQLWDKDMTRCEHKISPISNRLVIFRTDQGSNHGHPDPLESPEGINRMSLATYYYVSSSDIDSIPYRSTAFKKIPGSQETSEIEELRKIRSQGRIENKTT